MTKSASALATANSFASVDLSEDIRHQAPELLEKADALLKLSKKIGASSAEVAVSAGTGLEMTVRQGDLDKVEFNQDQYFTLTLYCGQTRGSAGTTDGSAAGLKNAVDSAWYIAQHTMPDECAGLAAADQMAVKTPDLQLYDAWPISPDAAQAIALTMEEEAQSVDSRITNSSGASVATDQNCFVYGNTHGFLEAVSHTKHSLSCAVIASQDGEMQQDYWYTVARRRDALESAKSVGRLAGERTIARLGSIPIATSVRPVVLASWVATGFIGHLMAALAGPNLYKKASFLLDSLGQQILPKRYSVFERPYLLGGLASAAFDADGLATREQSFIVDGVLEQYVLSTYAARRLQMQPTANGGGVHNLHITDDGLTLPELLTEMGDGFYVTELLGQGVNLVTGDYSRGASGFLVEGGQIVKPVQSVIIAGNLKSLLRNIRAIGKDAETRSSFFIGSILLDDVTVAGT